MTDENPENLKVPPVLSMPTYFRISVYRRGITVVNESTNERKKKKNLVGKPGMRPAAKQKARACFAGI